MATQKNICTSYIATDELTREEALVSLDASQMYQAT